MTSMPCPPDAPCGLSTQRFRAPSTAANCGERCDRHRSASAMRRASISDDDNDDEEDDEDEEEEDDGDDPDVATVPSAPTTSPAPSVYFSSDAARSRSLPRRRPQRRLQLTAAAAASWSLSCLSLSNHSVAAASSTITSPRSSASASPSAAARRCRDFSASFLARSAVAALCCSSIDRMMGALRPRTEDDAIDEVNDAEEVEDDGRFEPPRESLPVLLPPPPPPPLAAVPGR